MNKILMYITPDFNNPFSDMPYEDECIWELYIDTPGFSSLPFGYVSSFKFATRPTKRQLRKAKRCHRKALAKAIEDHEWNNSWEAIHCDIIGL